MTGDVAEKQLAANMKAAQNGDAAAYCSMLRNVVPIVAAIARGQGIKGDRVDDVIQDTLLTVHRARATYDPGRPFLPWLRAIAQRRAIDALRRHGRSGAREVHDPHAYENEVDAGDSAAHSLGQLDDARRLREAIATLPACQRQAVEHLALGECPLDELAALTGRSKGALKVSLHRALKTLRARLPETSFNDV